MAISSVLRTRAWKYSKVLFFSLALCIIVKVAQMCLTLCDPMAYTVHGILQARILDEWPFLSPGGLPNPGIEPRSPTLQADSLPAQP